ncbi:MAG: nucleotidyl transferase AbiEii/AbiGii toxin family protein [Candidatus Pacebacteria bacterium]|nr:nucleotidyl transferase AbiEii/AbiGii toxin family protein [Candidatus Paceibacterota bacterium]
MSEQISTILKRKLDDLAAYGGLDAETRRNALKEELQYYILNFIYHHSEYNNWIMYGGSALRIIHGLDRMSVDLDFEVSHAVTNNFLEELKKKIEEHFLKTYGAGPDFMTAKITNERGLLLKFHVGEELSFGHPSKQVHIKIDLNYFVATKTVTERRPINRDQLSFVIITYNMSSLMASKLAAIFLRGTRGVSEAVYEEKGRDIYDLLWYMNKKIVPDFDYLVAKSKDTKDPRALFDKLTLQINKVSDENLKQDLESLFVDKNYIRNWLKNWRESYIHLLDAYKIRTVTGLKKIAINEDFSTDNFSFTYVYDTMEKELVKIVYTVTYEWIKFQKPLSVDKRDDLMSLVSYESGAELSDQLKQFVALFFKKNVAYLEKVNRVMLRDAIITKVIRMTADNLNQKEQIVLNKSTLLSCELDDLLK